MSIDTLYTDIYCESIAEGSRRSAEEIVPLIMELLSPASIIDVGCGLGTWLSVFKAHGVNEILGVDGDYISRDKLQIRSDEFLSFDLKFPLQMGRKFDLVVSLEVAEHLPIECAETFIQTLAGLGDAIFFSAAIPFQAGLGHLNGQWPVYWVRLFQRQGFRVVDCLREKIWDNERVEPWFSQNMFLFVRHGRTEKYPRLEREFREVNALDLSKIHPRIILKDFGTMQGFPRPTGKTFEVRIEATEPIADIIPPEGVESVLCCVETEGISLGQVELPVCGKSIPNYVLTDVIASNFAWQILGRFFERTIYMELRLKALYPMGKDVTDESAIRDQIHEAVGWTVFLQELWGRPEWPQHYFYNPDVTEETAVLRHDESGRIAVEASHDLPDIQVTGRSVEVVLTVGGVAVGVVSIKAKRSTIKSQELRAALNHAAGFELCITAVREGLIGHPVSDHRTLRERLATAAVRVKTQNVLNVPCTSLLLNRMLSSGRHMIVLGRHTGSLIGTSVSRRAVLPVSSGRELTDAAAIEGEPIIDFQPSDEPLEYIIYAPDVIPPPPGEQTPSGTALIDLRTRKSLLIHYISNGPKNIPSTYTLPILFYHLIRPSGPSATRRYRVTPEALEDQLYYLRMAGYYSISLDEWWRGVKGHRPIAGRRILITFDGGYSEFLRNAWPLLKRYGFSAMVFLTTDDIGKKDCWDGLLGEDVAMLGWEQIRELREDGIEFGALSAGKSSLILQSPSEIVREGARSRAVLRQGLGLPAKAFAYPYGDENGAIQHLIGACGYIFGLTWRPGLTRFHDPLLSLPRIEVTGNDGLSEFINKLNQG